MRGWLAEFRWFLACTAVCGLAFLPPDETVRTVAVCAFVLLGPALFVLAAVDVVRGANAKGERDEPRSATEVALTLPFRGLVALFGLATVLIGFAICAALLYQTHLGGLPLVLSLFLGAVVLSRFFWARQALSFGGHLVRTAFGREGDPFWQVEQRACFEDSLRLAPHGEVRLALRGSRTRPDEEALALARELPRRYPDLLPAIAEALFEHYEVYLDAHECGQLRLDPFPRVAAPAEVWPHVAVDEVRVEPLDGQPTIEIAFDTAWDVEHRVGARIRGWRLVELNGSV